MHRSKALRPSARQAPSSASIRGQPNLLDEQRIDVDQADLEQMQTEHRDLLQGDLAGSEVAAFAVEDEIVGAIPIFDDVEALLNFLANSLVV